MAQNHKTVLVVEDSPVQAVVLTRFLEQLGLRVLHAPNGRVGAPH
jgi:CheY-like chemotaxis protein